MESLRKVSYPLEKLFWVKDVGLNYWTVGRGKQRGKSIGSRILYDGSRFHPDDIPFVKGGDFTRYTEPEIGQHWLRYNYKQLLDPESDVFRFSGKFLQVPVKILYRQTSDCIVASIDRSGALVDKTVHVIIPRSKEAQTSLNFVLSLLNSHLISHVYDYFAEEDGRAFAQVKAFRIEKIPIRRIGFTTQHNERKKLLEKGKAFYQDFLVKGDTLCITAFVEELLPKDKEANFLAFTVSISVKEARDRGFLRVDHPSSIKDEDHSGYDGKGEPLEKSDVVHDFLAFLTEQMIELNEEKQDEIRRFLAWLDKAIKVGCGPKGEKGIEALTGKTNIKNYLGDYAKNKEPLAFKQLLHILHKNRNRLGVNLSDSKLVGDVRDKYEESLARLLLIRNRLKKTDYLIDQIVYRLYGLTEEEIATIEGREENRIVGAQKGLS